MQPIRNGLCCKEVTPDARLWVEKERTLKSSSWGVGIDSFRFARSSSSTQGPLGGFQSHSSVGWEAGKELKERWIQGGREPIYIPRAGDARLMLRSEKNDGSGGEGSPIQA